MVYTLFPQLLVTFPLGFFTALCQYVVMVCIYCNGKSQVVNSRHQKRSNAVWRRRKCLKCQSVITTIESADLASSLTVVDRDGSLRPFLREKLLISIYESCKHRPKALADATHLTQTVLDKLQPHQAQASVNLEIITTTTAQTLDTFDKAAAVYFRAYHTK